jgi:hypothetical protein
VKAVRSGRIGIWWRNRHRTMRSISASVGDQNGTSHGPLWEAARAEAVQPTRVGHPRFLDAVGAQTADFNEVRSPQNPAILGLMRLNFLSVIHSCAAWPTPSANVMCRVVCRRCSPPRFLKQGICRTYKTYVTWFCRFCRFARMDCLGF